MSHRVSKSIQYEYGVHSLSVDCASKRHNVSNKFQLNGAPSLFRRRAFAGPSHMTIPYPKPARLNAPPSPRELTATQQGLDEQAAFFAPRQLSLAKPWLR